jgi:hypothetical protein
LRASKADEKHNPAIHKRVLPGSLQLVGGLAIVAGSCVFLWFNIRPFLADAIMQLLSSAQVNVSRSVCAVGPQLAVRLLDGSSLDITLTWQRSGLVSASIFGVLFVFLMFPLKGSMLPKMLWLELGFVIGVAWTYIRLLLAIFVSYHFGAGAFAIAEFFTGPITDFFWMVSVWSLSLSAISARLRRDR